MKSLANASGYDHARVVRRADYDSANCATSKLAIRVTARVNRVQYIWNHEFVKNSERRKIQRGKIVVDCFCAADLSDGTVFLQQQLRGA